MTNPYQSPTADLSAPRSRRLRRASWAILLLNLIYTLVALFAFFIGAKDGLELMDLVLITGLLTPVALLLLAAFSSAWLRGMAWVFSGLGPLLGLVLLTIEIFASSGPFPAVAWIAAAPIVIFVVNAFAARLTARSS